MSTSLVIVAIPEEQDRVWKVSSEQVPHLTLLYLGDVDQVQNLDQVMQFVDHAVTLSEHGPFYLDVDRRGTLGEAKADVLFFNKRSWNLKWIRQFRGQLLQNQAIRTAFDQTDQILEASQEWLPHLTLGYPDKPAKPLPDGFDHPFYSVCFDRIAVWAEDFNGPEFQLEWPEREFDGDLAIAYSDTKKAELVHYAMNGRAPSTAEVGEEFLEHFGKKGMKWGVRNDSTRNANSETTRTALLGSAALLSSKFRKNVSADTKTKVLVFGNYALLSPKVRADLKQASQKIALDKADSKWEKGLKDGSAFVAIHNASADHFNTRIGELNAKHPGDDPFKGDTKNFDDPSTYGPKYKSYMKDVDQLSRDSIAHAANELHLKNPSGTKEVEVTSNGMPGDFTMSVKQVQHAADDSSLDIKIKYETDSNGLVTGFTFPDDEGVNAVHSAVDFGEVFVEGLMHGATSAGEEFILEHFGIKGMRWGFRKSKPAAPISSQSTRSFTGKAKVETEGGHGHPAHQDAIKVAEARTKLKKSGPAALSNHELREVANRLQLENQVTVLTSGKARLFVSRQLETEGQNLARSGIREGAKRGAKKAGAAAAGATALLL